MLYAAGRPAWLTMRKTARAAYICWCCGPADRRAVAAALTAAAAAGPPDRPREARSVTPAAALPCGPQSLSRRQPPLCPAACWPWPLTAWHGLLAMPIPTEMGFSAVRTCLSAFTCIYRAYIFLGVDPIPCNPMLGTDRARARNQQARRAAGPGG